MDDAAAAAAAAAEPAAPLERSVSQHSAASAASTRSYRSGTVRARRSRLTSHPSSSASSIAASDKSLTSFPSFSPESPRDGRRRDRRAARGPPDPEDGDGLSLAARRRSPDSLAAAASIVDSLTSAASAPASAPAASSRSLRALFEDAPPTNKIPGSLHLASDAHIERLIARHGAVGLVRQIAEDLARRDDQVAALRRRADERERALRKIILECGLSNLDLETRLRAIEQEARAAGQSRKVSDLMSDAMADTVTSGGGGGGGDATGATIRARTPGAAQDQEAKDDGTTAKGTTRGWKDFLWGAGTSRRSSRASSVSGEGARGRQPAQTVVRAPAPADRRPTLQEDLFSPPGAEPARSPSRASSAQSGQAGRKPSLASMALRLVAGGAAAATAREGDPRGRAGSSATAGGSLRTPSTSSARPAASARAASAQGGPKALMAMRRPQNVPVSMPSRAQPQERWDTMGSSPATETASRQESYGPVEMDAILPPETQPPTLTHIYNNYDGSEYLTDRFGFIYDQRRKRRQREAAQVARHSKRGSRTEMLTNGRPDPAPAPAEDGASGQWSLGSDGAPESPSSAEDAQDRPRRWQDYLRFATVPTELLSHTPAISAPTLEVTEGGEAPRSPGLVASENGLVPPASTTSVALDSEAPAGLEAERAAGTMVKEDSEPVRLLLHQLSELHDSLQRDKTVRWNDFLRKVRAEKRREGEMAAATAAAAAEARFQRAAAVMPEARLADGELIGIAGWANKGKAGRAKWNEFRALVLAGIPVAQRPKIWSECSGALALRVPGHYGELAARPAGADSADVVQQIRADIHRTLTDNIFFRRGPGVRKLEEVLLAYARRNPDVGYCQGMNLVAANLLLIMPSAEDAFWVLASVVEHILPAGYYDHSLLASRADQQVLRRYVGEVLPRLSAHFDALGIALETMTFPWFLSVFTDCLSAEALFRVWDVVLCTNDGSTFLFQVALALLKLNERQLLACRGPAAVYTYINHQMTNHAISIDGLIQASDGLRRVVRRDEVDARRARAIEAEEAVVREREERLAGYRRSHQHLHHHHHQQEDAGPPAPAEGEAAGSG